jgi:hypothetical protein
LCTYLDALNYAGRGWRVIYVRPRAKNPVPDDWQHIATTDVAIIQNWWSDRTPWNVGVQLGPKSGIIDVECDSSEAEQALGALLGESAPVVPTFLGKRGKHRLFLYTPNLPCPDKAVFHFRGVEFRTGNGGKGAQSLFPPSVHPDGPVYRWLVHPDDADPVPFPADALAVVHRELSAKTPSAPAGVQVGDILFRSRNTRLTSMAGSMRRAGFNREEILGAICSVNERRCKPPLECVEVERIATSVARYQPTAPILLTIIRGGRACPKKKGNSVLRCQVEVG